MLILSGLYGFISPEDTIQSYDCDLKYQVNQDEIGEEFHTLWELWTDILTNILQELVDKYKVQFIVDMLSKESYQNAIRWEKIKNVEVMHRGFCKRAGPEILPDLALFLKNDVAFYPASNFLKKYQAGVQINRSYFSKNDALVFEKN